MYMQSLVLRGMVFSVLSRALAPRAPVKHNDHSISCAFGLAAHCSVCGIMNTFSGLNLIGKSHSFTECLKVIRKIAKRDATVLIQGETGTGKEVAARAIHYLGPRRDKPFVPLNCGAIPDGLIESELFGHQKGAFTDAKNAKPGVVAQAEHGTLFLDEVDTLSPKGQVTLLRFLQDLRYRPLGHQTEIYSDVRIIAATNQPVADLVRAGRVRQDLVYRLNILPLMLPPLRDRKDDAVILAEHFVNVFADKYGLSRKHLDRETLSWIRGCPWPGNIRELENFIHREFLMAESDTIHYVGAQSDAATVDAAEDFRSAKARAIAAFERSYLAHVISQARGNVSCAARIANKDRRAFAKLLKKHQIDRLEYIA
jgi:two-component system response regulator GlrR